MTEHNAQATQAATEAVQCELGKHFRQDDEHSKEWVRSLAFDTACAAVDAATPHILAAADRVITKDQAREIMQQQVEAEKPRLLAEVAAATDERLERTAALVRAAERARIRQRLVGCPECGEIHREGREADHPNKAPWRSAGPNALAFLDELLGDGPLP